MGQSKEYFLIMQENEFNSLTEQQRGQFSHVEVKEVNEWEIHKNDAKYLALKKAERKAKKELQIYLFDKRHLQKSINDIEVNE